MRGFSLAEAMVAMLFLSIALFGYVSLHIRLIHSGHKLEVRQERQCKLSQKIGGELFGEKAANEAVPVLDKPFDYLPGSQVDTRPPVTGTPLVLPCGIRYVVVEEEWHDRNGDQRLLVDTCQGSLYQGW
ncbi:MAG: hypothetical protein AB1758_08075 [Candidatus Eremiobacterota bacterium]